MNGVQRLLGGEVGLCFLNEYVFKEKLHFLVTWKKVMCTQMLAIIWEMAQAQKFWLETIRKKNVLHHQLMHCFSFPFMLLTRPRDKGPAVIHLVRWVKSLRVIPVIWKKKPPFLSQFDFYIIFFKLLLLLPDVLVFYMYWLSVLIQKYITQCCFSLINVWFDT